MLSREIGSAQISYSRVACGNNPQMIVRHFGFMEKVYGFVMESVQW